MEEVSSYKFKIKLEKPRKGDIAALIANNTKLKNFGLLKLYKD